MTSTQNNKSINRIEVEPEYLKGYLLGFLTSKITNQLNTKA